MQNTNQLMLIYIIKFRSHDIYRKIFGELPPRSPNNILKMSRTSCVIRIEADPFVSHAIICGPNSFIAATLLLLIDETCVEEEPKYLFVVVSEEDLLIMEGQHQGMNRPVDAVIAAHRG